MIMALVGGILASRFGARIIVAAGLFITALGMLLTGLADGLAAASVGRFITGMGNAMVLPPSIALMAAWFEPRRLGMASGIVPAGSSFALLVVGPLVPRIIAAGGDDGWRLAWYFFAATTLAIAVAALTFQRDRPHAQRDVVIGALRWADMRSIVRSRRAWLLGLLYFLYGFAFLLFFTFFQKRLTTDLGYSSETAGNLFLVVGVTGCFAGVLWGRVSDSIGRGVTLFIVFMGEAAVALVFALWNNLAALAIGSAVLGICALSVPGLFGAACGDRFGARLAAASLGFVTVFVGLGQMIGPYVGGALEDAFSSLAPSYLLSAAVFAVGGLVSLLLKEDRRARMRSGHTYPT